MRVAVVHSYYEAAQPSGENEAVEAQCEALERAGAVVDRVAVRTDDMVGRRGYRLRCAARVATGRGADPAEMLGAMRPDVVHVHNLFPNWADGFLAQWVGRSVVTVHNYRFWCANAILSRPGSSECRECLDQGSHRAMIHGCYRGSRLATLPLALASARGGQRYRDRLRGSRLVTLNPVSTEIISSMWPLVQVHEIPNFVDIPDPAPEGRRSERFVSAGRLGEEKGILQLLRSWPVDRPLDVFGGGPLANEVKQASARLPKVTQHRLRPVAEVRAAMRRARAVVLPSMCMEGLPTVLLEALSVGTPVLVSRKVALAQRLVSAGCALSFDPAGERTAEELAQAAALPAQVWERLGERGREVHGAEYSPEAWTRAMIGLYEDVLGSVAVRQ